MAWHGATGVTCGKLCAELARYCRLKHEQEGRTQSGAMGDLSRFAGDFSKAISEARETGKWCGSTHPGRHDPLIDNYDFLYGTSTWYFCELGAEVQVRRNDALTLAHVTL